MKLLFKNIFVKIKKARGRFLSLLFITALGVGFFTGLRETAPNMLETADSYYDKYKLMDFKITSTMGLTETDISALKKIKEVETVVPSYSLDVLVNGESIRLHALEDINIPDIIDGRLPIKNNECIADSHYFKIGDKIKIEHEKETEYLKNNEFIVVGTADSVLYISNEKGISNIGNGKLISYLFIPKDNFMMEYYSEAYLIGKKTISVNSYSEKYQTYFKKIEKNLLQLKPIQETKRYEEILEKATNEIIKIETKINKEKETGLKKLKDAKEELDLAKEELEQGKQKLENSELILNETREEQEKLILAGFNELEKGKTEYQQELEKAGLDEQDLSGYINNLEIQIETLENLLLTLDPISSEYLETKEQLVESQIMANNLLKLKLVGEQLKITDQELKNNRLKFEEEMGKAETEIIASKEEILRNEQILDQGYLEYQQGVTELEEKTEEANQEISKAKQELDDIEKPVWYLLNRTNNVGYVNYKEDATKVAAIAKIFPVFFIIIVYLISLNTMTRMIEEERTEIGILSSLGYSKTKIILTYLFYVLLATILGLTFGLLIGYNVIPRIIYSVYTSTYILPDITITVTLWAFIFVVLVTILLMLIVTLITCYKELKDYPSNLLRPKAPKKGKKVLLERILFIWKRLSFTWKVTIRNMFRYKKRIIMTVLGIAGCTALLLTGFGLKDGIGSIVPLQYGNIIKYDATLVLDKKLKTMDSKLKETLKNNKIKDSILINQSSYTFNAKDKEHDVFLVVSSKSDDFKKYLNLENIKNNKRVTIPDYGVVMTEKMAQLLDVSVGDSFKIRDSDNQLYILYVSDIVKNYTLHYLYMSDIYYEKVFEKEIEYNVIIANLDEVDHDEFAKNLIAEDNILTINFTSDNIKTFNGIVKGLNKIVYLIVGASCLLAFIVLYNLTTININERIREIATLKVLGFYDNEVSSYVYRETVMLTLIGILLGYFLGAILHRFVIITAETDNILFLKEIKWQSYIYAFIITIVFTIIVRMFTYVKLKKINMIESLKSVE